MSLQNELIQRRTLAMTAVRNAQLLDCVQFYEKYEKSIEWDEIDNLFDFNEGSVNLIYHGSDYAITIQFFNGDYIDWSYSN